MQTWAFVEHGYWYARSAEFLQTDTMQALRWLRVIGDIVFAVGSVALVVFVAGLTTGWSIQRGRDWPVAIGGRRRVGPRLPPRNDRAVQPNTVFADRKTRACVYG